MHHARRRRQASSVALLCALLASLALLAGTSSGRPSPLGVEIVRGRLPVHAAVHVPCSCIPVTDEREGERLRAEMGRDCGPWYD
jgi:hypothetical protein